MTKIKETSEVKVTIDGKTIRKDFQDANDAKEIAINKLNEGAKEAIVTEIVKLKKK